MPKEMWYRLSWEGKGIWVKLSKPPKATFSGNTKTPHKPSTHVNFHNFTLGDLIQDSSDKFYFGEPPNGPSNDDLIGGDQNTDNYGNTYMILTNLSKRDKVSPSDIIKVLSRPNPYSTQMMKYITIDRKMDRPFNTLFIYVSTHNCTHC